MLNEAILFIRQFLFFFFRECACAIIMDIFPSGRILVVGLVPCNLISSLEIWLDAKVVLNESRALGRAKCVLYGFSDHSFIVGQTLAQPEE